MLLAFLRAVVLAACVLTTPPGAAAIDFAPSLAALRDAQPDDARPIVIVFGSQSCGWCRKLAADTLASRQVADEAGKFQWVKADVDEEEELAARYSVRGLPDTVVIDRNGHVLAERAGYMPPDDFVEFLRDALEHPAPTARELDALLAELQTDEEALRRDAVRRLVARMARFDAAGRDQAIAFVNEGAPELWIELAPHLTDRRLAIRATAAGFLLRATRNGPAFDPFAAEADRAEQFEAWRAWFADRGLDMPDLPPDPDAGPASEWTPGAGPPPPPVARPLSTTT